MRSMLLAYLLCATSPAHGAESVLKGFLVGAGAASWSHSYEMGAGLFSSGRSQHKARMGAASIGGGYAMMRDRGFGFEADASVHRRFHPSDYEAGWSFLLQGNATFGLSRVVYVFAGPHWLQDLEHIFGYSGYGVQGGLAFVIGERVLWKVGYMWDADLGIDLDLSNNARKAKRFQGFFTQVFVDVF